MIQRIQTLYLFVVVVLFVTMLINPLMDFKIVNQNIDIENIKGDPTAKPEVRLKNDVRTYQMTSRGIVDTKSGEKIVDTSLVTIFEVIVAAIAFISIFLFKKRTSQIKLTVFNIVLQLGFYIIVGIYCYTAYKYANAEFTFHLPIVFPLISAILSYLAFRAITKDELLVRSLGRVR